MSVTSSRGPTGDGHADYFRIAGYAEVIVAARCSDVTDKSQSTV